MYWDRISRFVTERLFVWVLLYVAAIILSAMLETQFNLTYWGNAALPLNVLVLSGLSLSMVVTKPHLSERLLNGNDVSYGIYIYRGPIINGLIVTQLTQSWVVLVLTTIVAAFLCAALYWYLVERPFLRLKTSTIHQR